MSIFSIFRSLVPAQEVQIEKSSQEIAPSPPNNEAPVFSEKSNKPPILHESLPTDVSTPSSITFYCHPACAASRAVILLLEHFQLTYTVIFQKSLPENNKNNNINLASLTDDQFKITRVDPRVLLFYISNKYQQSTSLKNVQKSRIMQTVYLWSSGDFGKIGEKMIQPFLKNSEIEDEFQLTNVKFMKTQLAVLEQKFLKTAGDDYFLANDELSIADLVVATQMDFYNIGDIFDLGKVCLGNNNIF